MKVLLISGSPNENGSTYTALSLMAEELEKNGVEAEIFRIGGKGVHGCIACHKCHELKRCVFNDGVNEVAEKLRDCDGLVLAAPTYYGGIAGDAKCFYDRLFFSGGAKIRGKVATAITVARRSGGEDTFHQLNSYLTLGGAVITPTTYWNVIHGNNGEEIARDDEGVAILTIAARTMAWLIKSLDSAKEQFPLPDMNKNAWTNFIR